MVGDQSSGCPGASRSVMSAAVVHVRVALLVAVIAALGLADTARAAGTGQIAGHAVDGSSGTPVANVYVAASPVNPNSSSSYGGGYTDSSGAYIITGLAPGEYTVDFLTYPQNYVSQYYSGQLTFSSATAVAVSAGQTTAGIDAHLEAGGLIEGRVTDASGMPLSGISVFAGLAGSSFGSNGTTDANGHYAVAGLVTGRYAVSFAALQGTAGANADRFATDYYPEKPDPASAQLVSVTQRQITGGINTVMLAPGSISGTIRGPGGQPEAGVTVTVTIPQPDGTQWWGGQATTGADGTYSVGGLAPGGWFVDYYPAAATGLWPEFYPSASTLAYARPVPISAGGVAAVDVSLVTSVCRLLPGCPPPPTQMRILRRGEVVLVGTISNRSKGRLQVVFAARRRHTITRWYRIRNGHFHVVLRLPRGDRRLARARVILTVPANSGQTSASLRVRIIAHRHVGR